jgi:hypothetical protein
MRIFLFIISITSKLKLLVFVVYLMGSLFFDIPHWHWLRCTFFFLVLIEPGAVQGLFQIFGNFYSKISHKFDLPSKENYKNKSDYIFPFSGKWTVWNGGVEKRLSHSWGLVSQRYAYDFVVVGDEGEYFDGDGNKVESYLCYGKDIVSPASGIVVKISNKHNDSRVCGGNKVFCDAWDIRGNYIVIQHNDSEYSLTAHIKKDSFTVKVGDAVKQGEVVAKCGNSGNTSEPHIHFQLQNGKNFFTSAGLPVAFSNIAAEDSLGYKKLSSLCCEGNLQAASGEKMYIGRGLNVENKGVFTLFNTPNKA